MLIIDKEISWLSLKFPFSYIIIIINVVIIITFIIIIIIIITNIIIIKSSSCMYCNCIPQIETLR